MDAFGYGFGIAIAVMAIMISMGGMAAGLGFAANNRKLKEFGKEELLQSLVNGALLGGLAILFMPNGIMAGVLNALTFSSPTSINCPGALAQNTAICFSYDYLSGPGYTLNGVYHQSVLSQVTALMAGFLALNAALGIIAGIKLSAVVISLSFSSLLNPIIGQIQYFIKTLTTISLGILVQSALLQFVAMSAISAILPIGLVLRTFYPTRKLGGFLIAVAIGTYVVLPMSYVMNANILDSYRSASTTSAISSLSGSAGSIESQAMSVNKNAIENIGLLNSIVSALNALGSGFSSIFNDIMSAISYFIMAAFILPAFSLVLTVISIKELSGVLGSEVSFSLFDMV